MKDKGNIFNKIKTLVTYKESQAPAEFAIPEINEGGQNDGSNKENVVVGIKDVSKNYDETLSAVKSAFNYPVNRDIVIREFKIMNYYKAFIFYIDGMADRTTINDSILRPLLNEPVNSESVNSISIMIDNMVQTNETQKVKNIDDIVYDVLCGDTAVYVGGCNFCVVCETKGYEKRAVEKPQVESAIRGAQEGFNEDLRTNITLVRRIIKNNNLTTEFMKVGKRNQSQCAVVYLNGLVNPAIVTEVKRRLSGIDTDFIGNNGMLEQLIEDSPMSILPTVLATERPDSAASHIVEGKVVIMTEGSPFSLVVPVTIFEIMHTPEDSTLRWQYGTFLRIIRTMSLFITVFFPALYIGVINFHQEMIPTGLLIVIARSRENVPFPTILEVAFMEFSFELIREAGIRIPSILGNTIGIVGALLIGQAAVQANLISPILVIVVSITGLSNFAIPDFSFATGARIIRIFFIALAALWGFYGMSIGVVVLGVILADTKSFGVPYLSFYGPKLSKSSDKLIRYPIWKQERRPDSLNPQDVIKQPKYSRVWEKEEPKDTDAGGGEDGE